MASGIERYGAEWSRGTDPLEIELQCIKRGGKWTGKKGQECGIGLFEHYMNARDMLWPKRYRHDWTDLIYREILQNIVTVFMGAGSTGKTSHCSEFALISYWARPHDTLVLVSTTTVDKLNSAILGEIKMLLRAGQDRFPWLDGHVIDSKHAIVTDDIEVLNVRDVRKGIIGKPCFPPGTLVDTPHGRVPIEKVTIGDRVFNAAGVGRVMNTTVKTSQMLIRVNLTDRRYISCTPDHPFLTQRGWVDAIDVRRGDRLYSHYETMRILREGIHQPSPQSEVLPRVSQKKMQAMRENVSRRQETDSFLRTILLREMDHVTPAERKAYAQKQGYLCNDPAFASYDTFQSKREKAKGSDDEFFESFVSIGPNQRRGEITAHPSQCRPQFQNTKTRSSGSRFVPTLSTGFGVAENKTGGGSGWPLSPETANHSFGFEANPLFAPSWVDGIEILKPERCGKYPRCSAGYYVHNLEVEGHPSYSVNGIIVHNCYVGQSWVGLGVLSGIKQKRIIFIADELQFMQPSFMDCLPNMFQSVNLDQNGDPDIKVIACGNPKHDAYDQLGVAAEPVDGWASVDGITETTSWETKFHRGRCVNLVGTDSPNFKVEEGKRPPYPGLINRSTVKLVEARWGKDSLQYWSQCKGIMRLSMLGKRVLTLALCKQYHAFDPVLWKDDQQMKIGFLDPAWGGINADRCVWGWLEFGVETSGREVIAFGEYAEVPIMVSSNLSPDDQIAQFVKREAKRNGIIPSNIFYGATGRGTTGAALAKVFGSDAPVPIAEGDKPTQRPARADLFIMEKHVRRHKRADEEFHRMNAELWFAVRDLVVSEQMRNMPQEVAREFSLREYMPTPGGKVELESKDDTRERMGVSPDLADAFSFGVDGARQRGFILGHAGWQIIEENKDNEDFFETEAKEFDDAIHSRLLSHSFQ